MTDRKRRGSAIRQGCASEAEVPVFGPQLQTQQPTPTSFCQLGYEVLTPATIRWEAAWLLSFLITAQVAVSLASQFYSVILGVILRNSTPEPALPAPPRYMKDLISYTKSLPAKTGWSGMVSTGFNRSMPLNRKGFLLNSYHSWKEILHSKGN